MTTVMFATPGYTTSSALIAEFRGVYEELHLKLLAAGLVVADDTGQLDFSTIKAYTQEGNYGYRIYQLADGNQLPIYLKIEFTCASQNGSQVPWSLWVSMGFGTDGAGNLTNSSGRFRIGATYYLIYRASAINAPLTSLISVSNGFIGVSWKQLIGNPHNTYGPGTSNADAPSLASFFVCRDTDDAGNPTSDGATLVLAPAGGVSTSSGFGGAPTAVHISSGGVVTASSRICLNIGSDAVSAVGGKLPIYNLYTMTPTPRRLAQLFSVARSPGAMGNDEFQAAAVGTTQRNFIAMNPVWPGDILVNASVRSCIAMLWE
ncbi:hypothetical protein ACNJYG_06615 [Pseudomonas sp. GW6]